jgi:hypothetical protein
MDLWAEIAKLLVEKNQHLFERGYKTRTMKTKIRL